jgi:hypothetical protein
MILLKIIKKLGVVEFTFRFIIPQYAKENRNGLLFYGNSNENCFSPDPLRPDTVRAR